MFEALIAKFGGYIAGIGALVAAAIGLFYVGKGKGRDQEKNATDAAISKQNAAAQETTRKVENEINQTSDSDVIAAAGEWVRNKDDSRG